MESAICPSRMCRGITISITDFLKHIKTYHSEENLLLSCPLCNVRNLQYNGLVSHWYRHHPRQQKSLKIPDYVSPQAGSSDPNSCTTSPGSENTIELPENLESETTSVQPSSCSDEVADSIIPSAVPPSHITQRRNSDIVSEQDNIGHSESRADTPSVQPSSGSDEVVDSIIPGAVPSSHMTQKRSSDIVSEQDNIGHSESRSDNVFGGDQPPSPSEVGRDVFVEEEVTLSDNEEGEDVIDGDECVGCDEEDPGLGLKHKHDDLSQGTDRGVDFLLTMKTLCGVNKTQLKTVVKESQNLMDYVFTSTVQKLSEAGCSFGNVNVGQIKRDVCGIFADLKSISLQEKHFMDQYSVIKPKYVTVDRELKRLGTGKRRKTTVFQKHFYYVPIIKVLERLLQHPDYNIMSQRDVDSDPDVLDCYMKGLFAKENPVLQSHPDALRIILYYDDVEMCSDLSSRSSGKQKLGAFYMTLDNIHPKYRASLKTISLVALANAAYFKTPEGADFVSSRIAQDLETLEKGVVINGQMVYGTLIAYTGDNLAIHFISGLKCGFTAHRLCRTCFATLEEVRSQVMEDPEMLRTVTDYERQVEEIEKARTQKERDTLSTEYGINKQCPLNSLASFHILTGTPADLMHNELEGSLSRNLKNIIRYCVEDAKIVTLKWLNEALKDFDYGYTETATKPSTIKADHLKEDGNLRQSSSQTWTLAFILPLILGPHIDEGDDHWKNFVLLLEIVRMIFSDRINKNLLPYLSSQIASYLSGCKALYGHLLPKNHFMVHYPRYLLSYGSLIDFICMRMEANHKFLKKQVYGLGNYKNIPKSLALTYQLCQAFEWSKPLIKPTTYGVLTRKKINQLSYGKFLSGRSEVVEASWISTGGFLFKEEDCYICVGDNEEGRPAFARVMHIVVWPQLFFVCHAVETEHYNTHYSAYKIVDSKRLHFYQISAVKGKRLFHGHYVGKDKYIVMKECIGESF